MILEPKHKNFKGLVPYNSLLSPGPEDPAKKKTNLGDIVTRKGLPDRHTN